MLIEIPLAPPSFGSRIGVNFFEKVLLTRAVSGTTVIGAPKPPDEILPREVRRGDQFVIEETH